MILILALRISISNATLKFPRTNVSIHCANKRVERFMKGFHQTPAAISIYQLTYMRVFGFQVCIKVIKRLTKKFNTTAETCVPGAVPGIGLMLIASVLCSKKLPV